MASKSIVSARDDKIVEYCDGGATMQEIAAHVGMRPESLGNHIARLQMERRIEKIVPYKREFGRGGVVCLFLKVGTELTHAPVCLAHEEKQEPGINWDFVRVMHRILHLDQPCSRS